MDKNKISFIAKTGISIVLLLLLFFIMRGKITEIIATLKSTNLALFFFGFALYAVLTIILCGQRLKMVFAAQKIVFSLWETVKLIYIGQFFNNFLPSTIGGDVYKVYIAAARAPRPMAAIIAVGMDRFFGFFATVIIAVTALFFSFNYIQNKAVIGIIAGLLISAILLILCLANRGLARRFGFILGFLALFKLDKKAKDFYNLIMEFITQKKLLFASIALSVILQLFAIAMVYVLALSININIPFKVFILLMPTITIVSQLPSLNGLGIREGAFVYFFKEFIPAEKSLALSLLFFAVALLSSFIGGLFYAAGDKITFARLQKYNQ